MNKQTNKTGTGTGSMPSWVAGTLAALLMLMATGAGAATTNTYYVDATGTNPQQPYDTWGKAATDIQTAVNLAQNDLVPGTIECVVLVTNGLYTLTESIVVVKGITLRSVNGPEVTAINGGFPASTNRCLLVTNCSAVISGFTVSNGFAYGEGADGQGGGIYASDATGIIENCLIRKNRADRSKTVGGYGGGMFIEGGAPIVRNCVIEANDTMGSGSKPQGGTGVYVNNSALFMYDCIVSNNLQAGDNGSGAGLLMGAAAAIVSNCQFVANSCSRFGANSVSSGTLTHCLFSNNYARSSGGGITLANSGSKLLFSRVIKNRTGGESGGGVVANRGIIENCEILFNTTTGSGGGVNCSESSIRNCLIAGNEATKSGGGLNQGAKQTKIYNCTVACNKAGLNGGGVNNASTTDNNVLNCIISGNSATVSNNYYSATTAIAYSCAPELPEGVNGNTTNAPVFLDAGSGTGLTAVLGDYRLDGASPCVDTGTNDVSVINTRDLNGDFRVRPLGGRIDMGCYEMSGGGPLSCQFAASPVIGVGPLSVAFDGSADGTNTVGATYRWNFGDGDVSDWSSNRDIYHTYAARVTPYAPTLEVTNAVGDVASSVIAVPIQVHPEVVYAATNGAHVSPFDSWAKAATNLQAAIDAAGNGYTVELLVSNGVYTAPAEIVVDKALPLRSVNGAVATVLQGEYPLAYHRVIRFTTTAGGSGLDGFTVTNGYFQNAEGAGVYIERASGKELLIQNCLIAGNVNANRSGGGMLLNYEKAVVSNCQFIGNSQGGGSYRGGGLLIYRGLVVDCLFTNNTALGSYGGGIAATTYASTIRNCRVVNNRAARGGGIRNESALIQNCLVAGNEATTQGGGIDIAGATARFGNCTVVRNTAVTAGGGVYQASGLATNMIVAYNQLTAGAANDISGTVTNFAFSCSSDLVDGVNDNRTADPRFVQAGQGYGLAWVPGDYRLWLGSPAVDSGIYELWMAGAVDLQGAPRVQGSAPNMGAYERVVLPPGTLLLVR